MSSIKSEGNEDIDQPEEGIILQDYKDRAKEFLKFPFSVQMKSLRFSLRNGGSVSCLRSQCNFQSSSANGLLIHLCRCVEQTDVGYTSFKGRVSEFLALEESVQLDCIDNEKGAFKLCLEDGCRFHCTSPVTMLHHLRWCAGRSTYSDSLHKAIHAAYSFYDTYRHRSPEWLLINDGKRRKVVDFLVSKTVVLTCLNCDMAMTTGEPLLHLEQCQPGSQIALQAQNTKPKEANKASPSKCSPGRKKSKKPDETYESYMGRIKDWQQLEMMYQRRVIGAALERKSVVRCLNETCAIELSTGPGMLYHSQRCGLLKEDYPAKCPVCKLRMRDGDVRGHVKENHPEINSPDEEPLSKRRRKTKPEDGDDEFEPAIGLESDESSGSEIEEDSEDETPSRRPTKYKTKAMAKSTTADWTVDSCITSPTTPAYIARARLLHQKFVATNCTPEGDVVFKSWIPESRPFDDGSKFHPGEKESMKVNLLVASNLAPESVNLYKSRIMKNGVACFCGGPISCLSWCPQQYSGFDHVAVCVFPTQNLDKLNMKEDAIQIWKVTCKTSETQCVNVIGHEYGSAVDISWCPSGGISDTRLGLLCVGFANGTVAIFSIPKPNHNQNKDKPEVLLMNAVWNTVISIPAILPVLSVEWSPFTKHQHILVATAGGGVTVINLSDLTHKLVCKAPQIRCARWISQKKVVIGHDRIAGALEIIDIEGNCIATDSSKPENAGPVLCSRPELTTNFISLPAKSCDVLLDLYWPHVYKLEDECMIHSQLGPVMPRKPQGAALSPTMGMAAVVDEGGNVVLSLNKYVCSNKMSRKGASKGLIHLKTVVALEISGDKMCMTHGDAVKHQAIVLRSLENEMSCENASKLRRAELSRQLPCVSLFHVEWNPTLKHETWLATGGQAGFLMLLDTSNHIH